MTTDPTFRLEEALCVFEDNSYLTVVLERLKRTYPHIKLTKELVVEPHHRHAAALRSILLGAISGRDSHSTPAFTALMSDPYTNALYNWSRHSRRIFALSDDLQLLLNATDIDNVLVEDIQFPFETFAIALKEPIIGDDGKAADLIMLNRERGVAKGVDAVTVLLYSVGYAGYRSFSRIDRAKLLQHLGRPQELKQGFRMLEVMVNKVAERPSVAYSRVKMIFPEESDEPLGDAISTVGASVEMIRGKLSPTNESASLLAKAWRIALGFCLYLDMYASSAPKSVTRAPVPASSRVPRMILDGAEVCLVQSVHVLTPEEREVFAHGSSDRSELSPHFRRGYWSRPPGKGGDPTAVKTVWHRPTIVRRDTLPDDALPLGAQSRVK